MSNTKTEVSEFIANLEAGTLESQLGYTLSKAALSVMLHGQGKRKGKVNLELTISEFNDRQVIISHKLSSTILTSKGKTSEDATTDTPFYVAKGGVLSIMPPKEEFTGQRNLQEV